MNGKNKTDQGASPSQHDRFVETARALGCDEDEAAFDEKLSAITRHQRDAKKPAVKSGKKTSKS